MPPQIRADALFLKLTEYLKGYFSAYRFNSIKREIEEISGVQFRLKDFRSTLTSITVNGDMSLLPTMSAQLWHSSLNTTQKFYYRMERGVAGKQLRDAWKNNPINAQKPVIDKKNRLYWI